MIFNSAECRRYHLSAGLHPDPLESLQRSPNPLARVGSSQRGVQVEGKQRRMEAEKTGYM